MGVYITYLTNEILSNVDVHLQQFKLLF